MHWEEVEENAVQMGTLLKPDSTDSGGSGSLKQTNGLLHQFLFIFSDENPMACGGGRYTERCIQGLLGWTQGPCEKHRNCESATAISSPQ